MPSWSLASRFKRLARLEVQIESEPDENEVGIMQNGSEIGENEETNPGNLGLSKQNEYAEVITPLSRLLSENKLDIAPKCVSGNCNAMEML